MTEEELQDTPSFRYKKMILPLIQVLDDLYGITFFRFVRIYKTANHISFGNSLNFALRYWNEYVDVDATLYPQFFDDQLCVKIYDGSRGSKTKKEKQMFEERLEKYQLSDQGMVIIRKTEDYVDTFNFSSIKYQNDSLNKLLQNFQNLKNYCDFFLQEIAEMLKDPNNYTKLTGISQNIIELSPSIAALSSTKLINVYYDNDYTNKFIKEKLSPIEEAKLTPAEVQCLYWLIKGKTAEETAIILERSRRTIESHLYAIRAKLGCHKTSAAILKAKKLGLIQDEVFTKSALL